MCLSQWSRKEQIFWPFGCPSSNLVCSKFADWTGKKGRHTQCPSTINCIVDVIIAFDQSTSRRKMSNTSWIMISCCWFNTFFYAVIRFFCCLQFWETAISRHWSVHAWEINGVKEIKRLVIFKRANWAGAIVFWYLIKPIRHEWCAFFLLRHLHERDRIESYCACQCTKRISMQLKEDTHSH